MFYAQFNIKQTNENEKNKIKSQKIVKADAC